MQSPDFPAGTDDFAFPGTQVVFQITVVGVPMRVGHQHVDILAHDFISAVTEDAFSGFVKGEHNAPIGNFDNAIYGGIDNGAQFAGGFLTAPHQGAITGYRVDPGGEQAERYRYECNGQCQNGVAVAPGQKIRGGLADKPGGFHRSVMHAGDGQPHHGTGE